MISVDQNKATLKVNPKVYPLEAVYSAAYVFLDKAYIVLDGDPKTEIIVNLTPKANQDVDMLAKEFYNELINYSDYAIRSKETAEIRKILLQRAMLTNTPSLENDDAEVEKLLKELESETSDDTEEIKIPWDEKNDDNADPQAK